jgi:hypothetical protein
MKSLGTNILETASSQVLSDVNARKYWHDDQLAISCSRSLAVRAKLGTKICAFLVLVKLCQEPAAQHRPLEFSPRHMSEDMVVCSKAAQSPVDHWSTPRGGTIPPECL